MNFIFSVQVFDVQDTNLYAALHNCLDDTLSWLQRLSSSASTRCASWALNIWSHFLDYIMVHSPIFGEQLDGFTPYLYLSRSRRYQSSLVILLGPVWKGWSRSWMRNMEIFWRWSLDTLFASRPISFALPQTQVRVLICEINCFHRWILSWMHDFILQLLSRNIIPPSWVFFQCH